jgi:hypothetical protein
VGGGRRFVDRCPCDGFGHGATLDCGAAVAVFGFAAAANAWATRGRFFGWVLLTALVGLALAGL